MPCPFPQRFWLLLALKSRIQTGLVLALRWVGCKCITSEGVIPLTADRIPPGRVVWRNRASVAALTVGLVL